MSQMCLIFQVFGLLYFSINQLSWKTVDVFPPVGYTAYFVLLLVILTAQTAVLTLFVSSSINIVLNVKSALNYIVQHSFYHGLVLLLIIGFIQSYLSTKMLRRIFINFFKISDLFSSNLQYNLDFSSVKLKLYKKLFCFFAFYVLFQIAGYSHDRLLGISNILNTLLSVLPVMFLSMISFKFVSLVSLVNYVLSHLIQVLSMVFFMTNEPKLVMVHSKYEANERKLMVMRRIYIILQENVELINTSMGLSLLFIFLLLALGLVVCGYNLFLTFVGLIPIDKTFGRLKNIS